MTGTHRADRARPAFSIPHSRRLRRGLIVLIVLGTAVALLGGRGGGAPLQASTTSTISRHAGSTTFESGSASTASTAAPANLRAGDVVLSYLQTTSASAVLCQTSTKVLDQTRGAVRLVACLSRVGATPPASFSASLTPAGPVAMITLAFSGVDAQTPVDVQASSASSTSPSVRTTMANEVLVLGEGSNATAATATAPTGTTLVRSLNNGARAQVAVAVMGTGAAGLVSSKRWAVSPNGGKTTAAAIALRPATSIPTPTTTTATTTPPATPTPTSSSASPTPSPTSARPTPSGSTSSRSPSPTPSQTSSSPSGVTFNHCASPAYTLPANPSNPQDGITLSGYYVDTDTWNFGNYPASRQTMYVCDYNNWYATVNVSDSDNSGAVKTYPNVHKDFSSPAVSSFASIRSVFAHTAPTTGAWDYAYDIWLNGLNYELMVWTQSTGRQAHVPGVPQAGVATLSGITYNVHHSGNYTAYDMPSTTTSGDLNLLEIIKDAQARGFIPSSATLTAIDYGVEVCDTGSVDTRFAVNNFSVTTS
jgi:hypothetical protein